MEAKKGRNISRSFMITLVIINFIISCGLIIHLCNIKADIRALTSAAYKATDSSKYVLYIGTNDKDTYTQLIPIDEAKNTVNGICVKYVDGYTVQEANGGWMDKTGTMGQEQTLIYSFNGATEEQIKAIMDEALVALNQNSIMVERYDLIYTYYSSNEK